MVGAGGFIGGFIARKGLDRGMDVTVAVRATTSRRYLTDSRLKFIVLDYDDPTALTCEIERSPRWDYIIYNLGATKAVNYGDFRRVNFEYLRLFCDILKETNHVPDRLLFMSSLSALGAGARRGTHRYRKLPCPIRTPATGSRKSSPNSFWSIWRASHTLSFGPQASTDLTRRTI